MGDINEMRRMIEGPVRLRLALDAVPGFQDALRPWAEQWIDIATADGKETANVALGASITATLDRLTFRVDGPIPSVQPGLAELLECAKASDERRGELDAAGESFEPERIGHYTEMSGPNMDAGWYFPVEGSLAKASAAIAFSAMAQPFARWAERQGIARIRYFARSVGADNPYAEVRVDLPGDAEQAIGRALECFDALDAPRPPEILLTMARRAIQPSAALRLRVWFTQRGTSRMGVLAVPGPDRGAILGLCGAGGGRPENLGALAAFEGFLGAHAPSLVEFGALGKEPNVELYYGEAV